MIRVLYVDDDKTLLNIGKLFLERNPEIKVTTDSSSINAFNRLGKEYYNVILSDYEMPEMDGIEFLKKINSTFKERVPFIIFTGRGREEVAIEALNNGATFYLQKGGEAKSQFAELIKKIESAANENTLKNIRKIFSQISQKGTCLENNLRLVTKTVSNILCADASFILLQNKYEELQHCVSYGVGENFKRITLKSGEGLGWKAMSSQKGFIADEYFSENISYNTDELIRNEGVVSMMATPLQIEEEGFGVLYAFNREPRCFSEKDLETLSTFGNLAAMAIIRDIFKGMLNEKIQLKSTIANTLILRKPKQAS